MDKPELSQQLINFIQHGNQEFLSHLSIDCVVFGFYDNQLKVLLLQWKDGANWSLPGGFIHHQEHIEAAARRILKSRTGLERIFLRQFYVFGDPGRSSNEMKKNLLKIEGIQLDENNWMLQRFISIGYYALVNFSKVAPVPDYLTQTCEWHDVHEIPSLIMDHNEMVERALKALRHQLSYEPIGYNLLPEKFTMPDLQKLYETILDKKLDRRNFQKKMLSFKYIIRLDERKKGGAHKAPYLYRFDKEDYEEAKREGIRLVL